MRTSFLHPHKFVSRLVLAATLFCLPFVVQGCGGGGSVSTSGATSTTLTTSSTSATSGTSITLTASISPSAATGTVTFYDGSASLGTGILASGSASFATSSLTVGSHTVTAVYGGDSSYTTSTSTAVTITVTAAALTSTTTTLVTSIAAPTYGTAVTLTATVAPATATGSITFYDGTTSLGAVTLNSGAAALGTSVLTVGTHSITATYAGSTTYATSTSSAVTVTVASAATTTSTDCSTQTGTAQIVCLANAYYATLSTTQQASTLYAYTLANAEVWSNLPGPSRNGLRFGALSTTQAAAGLALIKAALSSDGGTRFDQLRIADDYLNTAGGGSAYGSGNYYIAFLGSPSTTSVWQLQVGGHHYALNVTYNGKYTSATPFFLGVEPTSFTSGGATYTVLEKQRAAAYALTQSLSGNTSALLSGSFDDVLEGINGSTGHDTNYPQTYPTSGRGVLYSSLSTAQQTLVKTFIEAWINDQNSTTAAALLPIYEDATALASTYVGYAGTNNLTTQGDYIRVDGPRVWIEFVCQNGVVIQGQIHYHSIWRDKTADYGGDF